MQCYGNNNEQTSLILATQLILLLCLFHDTSSSLLLWILHTVIVYKYNMHSRFIKLRWWQIFFTVSDKEWLLSSWQRSQSNLLLYILPPLARNTNSTRDYITFFIMAESHPLPTLAATAAPSTNLPPPSLSKYPPHGSIHEFFLCLYSAELWTALKMSAAMLNFLYVWKYIRY